jgi:RNA polymerase sigma-70 factor (ECF subfamily)
VEAGSDHELMMRVREGQTSELAVLFERHHGRLLNYFLRTTGNRAVGEDLVQEVFVRMLRYRESYRGHGQGFSTWMYTLARHARADHRRRAALRDHSPLPENEPPSDAPTASERFEKKQSLDFLRRALERLPDDLREVLVLRRFEMKFTEIAEVLDCPVGTAKVRAHRAIRELRKHFNRLLSEARP